MKINKVNGIRIFFIVGVLLGIGCYQAVYFRGTKAPQELETEQIVEKTAVMETEEEAVPVSQTVDYKYVIVEEGDYLTVYLSDRKTVYEYTGIQYSKLEEEIKEKIRKGYCVKDEAALFGFLENYSS